MWCLKALNHFQPRAEALISSSVIQLILCTTERAFLCTQAPVPVDIHRKTAHTKIKSGQGDASYKHMIVVLKRHATSLKHRNVQLSQL